MAEQFGVVLGGPLVKPFDGAVITGVLPQVCDEPPSGGTGSEAGQRHRAPNTSARQGFVLLHHPSSYASDYL